MSERRSNSSFGGMVLRQPLLQATMSSFSCVVAYLPLVVLVGAYVIQPGAFWLWIALQFLLTFVAAWFGCIVRRVNPVLQSLSAAVIALLACTLFADAFARMAFAVSFILCAALAVPASITGVNGLRIVETDNLLPAWLLGLPCHFAALFLFTYLPSLRADIWVISVSACINVIMVLYSLNQAYLDGLLSDAQPHVPQKVVRFNRQCLTLFLGILLLVFACFGFFVHLSDIGRIIANLLQHLFFGGQTKAQSSHIHMPAFKLPKHPQMPAHQSGSDVWRRIVSIIIAVLAFIAILFLIVRGAKALWRWYQKHRDIGKDEGTGYVDEEESIAVEIKRVRRFRRDRKKRRERAWTELSSPEEQVRYLYRQFVRTSRCKGYVWASTDTARETTAGVRTWFQEKQPRHDRADEPMDDVTFTEACRYLEDLYDRARYGHGPITKDEVEHLRNLMRV